MTSQTGYSLVELMVTVAVITILTGIAIPLYNGYIREGHFVSMRTTINGMRTSVEDFRLENGNYGPVTSYVSTRGSNTIGTQFGWEASGDIGAYTYTLSVASTNSYDIWGIYNPDTSIWARCDNRFQRCCDSDTEGSATIVACGP